MKSSIVAYACNEIRIDNSASSYYFTQLRRVDPSGSQRFSKSCEDAQHKSWRFTLRVNLSFGGLDGVTHGLHERVARSGSVGMMDVCVECCMTSPRLRNGHFSRCRQIGQGRWSLLSTASVFSLDGGGSAQRCSIFASGLCLTTLAGPSCATQTLQRRPGRRVAVLRLHRHSRPVRCGQARAGVAWRWGVWPSRDVFLLAHYFSTPLRVPMSQPIANGAQPGADVRGQKQLTHSMGRASE